MSITAFRASVLLAVLSGVYSACGSDGTTPPIEPRPSQLVVVSGDGQTGTVGQLVGAPLVVRVNDQSGNSMSGVAVAFSVTEGGGSVSSASSTTDGSGQASTNWTLGTTAGAAQRVTVTVPSAASLTAAFSATASADVPVLISADSGNQQLAFRGTKLLDAIVVRVRDQFANGVPNQLVQFSAAPGNGTLDSAAAFTDATGRARTGWTLGADLGEDTAQATIMGLTGSPVTFTATAHNLSITSVSPDPLILGQNATIVGSGFDAIPGNNAVVIGGAAASVTAASPTQLDIIVPDACLPAGTARVEVTVGAITSAPVNSNLAPASQLSLAAGEFLLQQDPDRFCLQFDESTSDEVYLIGIQAATEVASSRTPLTLTSVIASGAAPSAPMASSAALRTLQRTQQVQPSRHWDLLRRHRLAETRRLHRQLEILQRMLPGLPRSGRPARVPPDTTVGDTVTVRIPDEAAPSCDSYTEITTVVRAVGSHGVWLEDIANPLGGFTTTDFQGFSDQFDNTIYDVDVAHFGEPTDNDGNNRIAVVVTAEVNKQNGVAGFVSPLDFVPRSSCAASNEGELFYSWAPDPTGSVAPELSLADARFLMPVITAHELVHVIQVGRRVQAGAPTLPTIWELEGQASFGEEVTGHVVEGNAVGQDLSADVALDLSGTASAPWYLGSFLDLYFYYGLDLGVDPPRKVMGAPDDCTWVGRDSGHECVTDLVNGVPWSFLRWMSDQFGPSFAGGEAEFQRALVDGTAAGFQNIADALGVSVERVDTLLAQWAAMLYVDNRVLDDGTVVMPDPALAMTSWDLFDIVDGIVVNNSTVHHLTPREWMFANFTDAANVRAASTAYFMVSGSGRPATAIRARDASDQALPGFMQMWVVRLK